jgi:hypothetical protein
MAGPAMPMPTMPIGAGTRTRWHSWFQMICSTGPAPRPPWASGQVMATHPFS